MVVPVVWQVYPVTLPVLLVAKIMNVIKAQDTALMVAKKVSMA